MTIVVVHYKHKYGDDISVCRSMERAEKVADGLIEKRVHEAWDAADAKTLKSKRTFEGRLSYFHDIENNVSEGESIELLERELM